MVGAGVGNGVGVVEYAVSGVGVGGWVGAGVSNEVGIGGAGVAMEGIGVAMGLEVGIPVHAVRMMAIAISR